LLAPDLTETPQRQRAEVAPGGPGAERGRKPGRHRILLSDSRPYAQRPLRDPADARDRLEDARPLHQRGISRKGKPLHRTATHPLLPVGYLGAQMQEKLGDVDLHGADVSAGAAETGGIGEL